MKNRLKSNASSQLIVIKKPNKNFWKIPTTLPSKKRTLDGQNIIFSAGNGQSKNELEDIAEDIVEAEGEVEIDIEGEEVVEGETEELTEDVAEETTEEATEEVTAAETEELTEEVTEDETTPLSRKKRQISVELEPIEVYLENDQVI